MRLAKGELLFVAPVGAVFAAALVLLVASSPASISGLGQELIGTITYKNHVAERKSSSQVMWNALAQSSPIYNGDTIHTTAGSSAVLHLDKQADIGLGEDTLVRIDVTPKRAEIQLDGGIISVRKPSSGRELGIATSAGKISMKDGELSAQGKGDKLLVSISEGRARVDAGKGSQDLAAGASIAFESGQTRRPIAQLLSPSVGSAVYRASAASPTAFRWSAPVGLGASTRAWRLVVASDAAFKQVEATCDAKGSDASLPLSEGTHYWKITAGAPADGAVAGESAVSWFYLLRQDSPQPIEPPNNQAFAYGEKPPLVSFSWSGVDNATGYRLTIASADTGATVLSRLVAGRSIALEDLSKGSYKWQVSALCAPDGKEFAGPGSSFSISPQALVAPRIREPSASHEAGADGRTAAPRLISAMALRRGATIAAWNEVPGADYYDARISRDREGAAPLTQARTAVNSVVSPIPLAPGDYFLQVRSISGSVASGYSSPIAFTVTAPRAIVALSPPEGFTADPETRKVRFVWDDPNDSGRVKLQLSADPQFDRPLLEILSADANTEADIPESASGRIYWRVASDERGLSSRAPTYSSVRTIRMPARLAPPRITGPSEGMVIDISFINTLRLGWEPSVGATTYQVSLYQLVGSRRSLIRAWDGSELFASLPKLRDLGIGQFSWSLCALRIFDGVTASRSPEEIAYFTLSHSHPLPPPVVHRPANGVNP